MKLYTARLIHIAFTVILMAIFTVAIGACAPEPKDNDPEEDIKTTEQVFEQATEVPQTELALQPDEDVGGDEEDDAVTDENNAAENQDEPDDEFVPTQEEPLAPPVEPAEGTEEAPEGELALVVSFDDGSGPVPAVDGMTLNVGEQIDIQVTIVNNTENAVSISFANSQKLDVFVMDSDGNPVYQWSAGIRFAQVISAIDLEPSESWAHEVGIYEGPLNTIEIPGTFDFRVVVTGTPELVHETKNIELIRREN